MTNDADMTDAPGAGAEVLSHVEHVVVDLPLELNALPGAALKFEGLDTDAPRLRTIDGARYVGKYELTIGETLVVGFDDDVTPEARVLATRRAAVEVYARDVSVHARARRAAYG